MLMKQKPWPKTKDKWTIDFSNIKTKVYFWLLKNSKKHQNN